MREISKDTYEIVTEEDKKEFLQSVLNGDEWEYLLPGINKEWTLYKLGDKIWTTVSEDEFVVSYRKVNLWCVIKDKDDNFCKCSKKTYDMYYRKDNVRIYKDFTSGEECDEWIKNHQFGTTEFFVNENNKLVEKYGKGLTEKNIEVFNDIFKAAWDRITDGQGRMENGEYYITINDLRNIFKYDFGLNVK